LAERWRVERASDNVDVARAAFYPNIDLRAAAGLASLGFSKFFDATSENSTIGPAISLPIFDGGQRRSGLQARTAEYDAAVHAYNATIVDALTDIADQISTLDALRHIAQQREEARAAAARAQYLAQQAFGAGLTDSLNVLHTQSMLSTQRNFVADIHFQKIVAWTALNQALGGGLVTAGNAMAAAAK
jgi:outer membrane protein TolC